MERTDDPRRALVLILLASASFACMWASTRALREVAPGVTPLETVFFRGVIGTIAGAAIHAWRGIPFRPRNKVVLVVRSATGMLALLCTFAAIQMAHTEIATANLLYKTAPLWVVLLSKPILGEAPGGRAKTALIVGLAGSALALGPSGEGERLGVALGLLSSVFTASAYMSIRRLVATEDPTTIVTCFTAFLAVSMAPFVAVHLWRSWPSPRALGLLVLVGVAGTAAQLFMTNAYRHATAAAVSVASLAEVGFTALASFVIFREMPTWNVALGGGLAVAAGVWATSARARDATPSPAAD